MLNIAMNDQPLEPRGETLPPREEALSSENARVDAELVKLVQQGHKRSFDLLVIKYQTRIVAAANRFVKDYSEAQDIAQESFVKAYRAIDSFRGESSFYTWLYQITTNTAKNYLQSRKRRPLSGLQIDDEDQFSDDIAALQDQESPEARLASEQLKRVIDEAVSGLSEELKSAIVMREFDGMSYEEIAEALECPIGTVRSRIFRAREVIDEKIRHFMQ